MVDRRQLGTGQHQLRYGDVISGAAGNFFQPAANHCSSRCGGFTGQLYRNRLFRKLPTVQWQFNNGSGWQNVSGGTVTPTTLTLQASDSYTSTYSLNGDGYEPRSEWIPISGRLLQRQRFIFELVGALITVVAPQAPYVLIQPQSTSVVESQNFQFTTYGTALPAATVQWQVLSTVPARGVDESSPIPPVSSFHGYWIANQHAYGPGGV